MISKSLSRKTPSFGQLAGYMSESGYMNSQKSDERYEIFQHCFSSRHEDIAAEFFKNSQLLRKRKNGNYLYHEILSISIEDGVERSHAKDALREIAMGYIAKRCPNNMVYGCLHDDHSDHIHYHLMISANEKGSNLRHRLSKKKFDGIKRDLEMRVLKDYPELKQRALITASRDEKKLSRKAAEEKRRNGKLERQEFARKMIIEAMLNTKHFDEFVAKLEAKNARYYKRGKNHAVEILHEDGKLVKYRFATIGVDKEFEEYLEVLQNFQNAEERMAQPESNAPELEHASETEVLDDDTAKQNQQDQASAHKKKERTQTQKKSATKKKKRSQKNSETKREKDDMKLKDVMGVHETHEQKSKKANEAKKSDIKAEAQKTQAQVDKSAQDTAKQVEKAKKETVDKLKKEFEDISKKQMRQQSKQSKS